MACRRYRFSKANPFAMSAPPRRFHLAVVEPADDVTDPSPIEGWLVFTRVDNFFELVWSPLENSPIKHVVAIFQNLEKPSEPWSPGLFLRHDCRKLAMLSLAHEGDFVFVSVFHREVATDRRFRVRTANFLEVSRLIEQLIVTGVAVPCRTDERPHALRFYERASRNVYVSVPPYIQLNFELFGGLPAFWAAVHAFFREIVLHLDESNTMPRDPKFPLADAAGAAHFLEMQKIYAFVAAYEEKAPITAAEWPALFDADGRLRDADGFFGRIFLAGVEPGIRKQALPFVFDVYPADSTAAERNALKAKLSQQYALLGKQVATVKAHQLDHHKKLAGSFRVINHDVSRTDRWHDAFKTGPDPANPDVGVGLTILTALLRAYSLYNPTIGYLQGMNDLFVPIILTYFPNWNPETGCPVNEDGEPVEYEDDVSEIFWDFEGMLRRTNHLVLLSSVTEQCQEKARVIARIISEISPLVAIWMRRNGLADLLWMYSDFVLLFKRSFDEIWSIWLQLNRAPASTNWLTYFVTGIMLETFPEFSKLPEVSITSIMDAFGNIVKTIDPVRIGKIALWIYKNHPIPEPDVVSNPEADVEFEFFHPTWRNK
jgi:hypothetical protein